MADRTERRPISDLPALLGQVKAPKGRRNQRPPLRGGDLYFLDPRDMREVDELLPEIVRLAKDADWLIYHQRPARTREGWRSAILGHAGFPDLVMVRRGVLVVAECKKEGKRPEPHQEVWLSAFRAVEAAAPQVVRVFVWQPSDLLSGRIAEVLQHP